MNEKTIIAIILGIFLISLTSAIFPGECNGVTFSNNDPVEFQLVSNSTPFGDWFNWAKSGTVIEYCFDTDAPTGEFEFKWFNEKAEASGSGSVADYSQNDTQEKNETQGGEPSEDSGEDSPTSEEPIADSEGLSTGEIILYSILSIILFSLVVYYIIKREQRKNTQKENIQENETKFRRNPKKSP